MDFAIVCCALSKHLTKEYEPEGGYNQVHNSIGVHIEQPLPDDWYVGGTVFYFKDSFNKNSRTGMVTVARDVGATEITEKLTVNHKLGLGIGHIHTSYYDGIGVMPYYEPIANNKYSMQIGYMPKVDGAERLLMFQFKRKF